MRRCNALLRRGISASASPQNRNGERSTAESRADSLPPDEGQAGWHHSSRLPGDHRQKAGATGSSVGRVTQRPLHTHDHTQTLTEREREAREQAEKAAREARELAEKEEADRIADEAIALLAEQKAARDARYAARKARKGGKRARKAQAQAES